MKHHSNSFFIRVDSVAILATACFGLLTITSQSAIIAQDDFNLDSGYVVGELTGQGNSHSGWSDNWNVNIPKDDPAPTLTQEITAGGYIIGPEAGNDINRNARRILAENLPVTGQIWLSLDMFSNNGSGPVVFRLASGSNDVFSGGLQNKFARISQKTGLPKPDHNFTEDSVGFSYTAGVGNWITLKAVVDYENDLIVFWMGSDIANAAYDINTGIATGATLEAEFLAYSQNQGGIDRIYLQSNKNNQSGFDNLVIASSGHDIGIVPEPNTTGLLALLAGTALLRRRR